MTATDMSVNVDEENSIRTNPWKKQLSVITASESGESVLFIHEVLIGSLSLIQPPWTTVHTCKAQLNQVCLCTHTNIHICTCI